MMGYNDWRDVRNDCLLVFFIGKLISLGWIAHDWWVFHNGGGSRVLGFIVVHFGWDSPLYAFIKSIWMWGR